MDAQNAVEIASKRQQRVLISLYYKRSIRLRRRDRLDTREGGQAGTIHDLCGGPLRRGCDGRTKSELAVSTGSPSYYGAVRCQRKRIAQARRNRSDIIEKAHVAHTMDFNGYG